MIRRIDDFVWVAEQPLKFFGLELGARMTIVDFTGQGDLFVHSPIKLTDDLIEEINQIGVVKTIVAPNLFHHLFAGGCKKQYPNATLYGVPGLDTKRSDITFDVLLEEGKEYPWSKDVKHHLVVGTPRCNEVVFFRPKTKTLLVTDLGIHICQDSPWTTRSVFKAMGMFKTFGWSKAEKWLFVRDKELFEASVRKILEWDFDKIVLSHGRTVENNGHEIFKEAFL